MNMPALPCTMKCPECPHTEEASVEDPDAAMSPMWRHLYWDHALKPGVDTDKARRVAGDLLGRVEIVGQP